MKRSVFNVGFLVLIIQFITMSCEELFVEELGDQNLELFAPYNGAELTDSEVTFWWSHIDGVSGYRLIVVSPEFDKIRKVVLDSTLTVERFNYVLTQGQYEWRIDAFNSADTIVSENNTFEIKNLDQ